MLDEIVPGMRLAARMVVGAVPLALLWAQPALAQRSGAQAGPRATPSNLASCGGQTLRGFIGKPVFHLTRRRPDARVVCEPGCMMTMDYRADRLTVMYDTRTKRIKRMRCG